MKGRRSRHMEDGNLVSHDAQATRRPGGELARRAGSRHWHCTLPHQILAQDRVCWKRLSPPARYTHRVHLSGNHTRPAAQERQ
jgi:hypothetical protein